MDICDSSSYSPISDMDTNVGFSSSLQSVASPSRNTQLPDPCLAPRRPVIKKRLNRGLVGARTPPKRCMNFEKITWAPKKKTKCSIRQTPQKKPSIDSESLLLAPRARRTPKSIRSNVQKRFEKITWAPRKTHKRSRSFSK